MKPGRLVYGSEMNMGVLSKCNVLSAEMFKSMGEYVPESMGTRRNEGKLWQWIVLKPEEYLTKKDWRHIDEEGFFTDRGTQG